MAHERTHHNTPSPAATSRDHASLLASVRAAGPSAAGLSEDARARALRCVLDVTDTPTAAGREQRIIALVDAWASEREDLALTRDSAGNLHVAFRAPAKDQRPGPPLYITAHMDHPAFVIERIVAPGVVQISFRGGVMDDYFKDARIVLHPARTGAAPLRAVLQGVVEGAPGPYKHYLAESSGDPRALALGDIGVWDVGQAAIEGDLLHTPACDDLSALAAALCAMDALREGPRHDVRLLLTRAEEVGFIGAIAAARDGTMQQGSRVLALENSRSFADSPINAGPIVRVGDRMSVFSPALTDAVAKRAEEIAGGPASVTASQKQADLSPWRWQRKLMAGGSCEASVYCAYGYECTCVCLPLGNYHNMADLDNVQAGKATTPARVAREVNGVKDYLGLVDLLVACGRNLPATGTATDKFAKLWAERQSVLA